MTERHTRPQSEDLITNTVTVVRSARGGTVAGLGDVLG